MTKIKAYSKVNLFLKVFPKRPNETKHSLVSLMSVYKPLYDLVEIEQSSELSIKYFIKNKEINFNDCPIVKLIKYLDRIFKTKTRYSIKVNKLIPIKAGLGSSSAAAATIGRWWLKKHNKVLTEKELKYIALNIGSDIPFLMSGLPRAIVKGYGEQIIPTKFNCKYEVITNNYEIPTATIYQTIDEDKQYVSKATPYLAYKELTKKSFTSPTVYNDMQSYVLKYQPQIQQYLKSDGLNNKYIISGSGGSVIKIIGRR